MTSRFFLAAIAASLLVTSCDRHAEPPPPPNELRLYIWADYIKPELVRQFENDNGCKVIIDTFDSNESMYAKLKTGSSGYDIAVPSSYMVAELFKNSMLNDITPQLVPNIENVNGKVANKVPDKFMKHSVPYAVGSTVIAYRKDKIAKPEATWALLERGDLNPKTTLLNDMRETLGAALKYLGFSINSRDEQELAQARDIVIKWKKNAAKFDNEAYKGGIDAGEFSAVMGYSGDLFQVVRENSNVEILYPAEGVAMACDEMVILRECRNPLLAHKFINFMLDAKVAAENMQHIGYLCPNDKAMDLAGKTFLENPAIKIPDDVMLRSEVIEELGSDLPKWTKAWDEVKAAP